MSYQSGYYGGSDRGDGVSITVDFWVRGLPQTQGSVRAILPRGSKHPVVIHDRSKELAQWRAGITQQAADAMRARGQSQLLEGPLQVRLEFFLQPPAGHALRTPRQQWQWSAPWRRPDLDKLQRAVLDALVGVLFSDDGQVVQLAAVKQYGQPGVHIVAEQLQVSPPAVAVDR